MDTRPGPPRGYAPPGRSDADLGAELRATLDARRDLGSEYELALVESFIERLDRVVDARVDARISERRPAKRGGLDGSRLALGIISLGVSIPLTGITLAAAHSLVATVIVWAAIVCINMAAAIRR